MGRKKKVTPKKLKQTSFSGRLRKKRGYIKPGGGLWTIKDLYDEVSEEQKEYIQVYAQKGKSVIEIAREIFDDPALVGGDLEVKFVTDFVAKNKITCNTQEKKVLPVIKELSEDEKSYVRKHYTREPSAYKLANLLFPAEEYGARVTPNSSIVKLIGEYIMELDSEWKSEFALSEFDPPTALKDVAPYIRKGVGKTFNPKASLSKRDSHFGQTLIKHLNFPRFVDTANDLKLQEERDSFINSYIAECWEKDDLEPSDLNLVVSLCSVMIEIGRALKNKNRLEEQMNQILDEDDKDISLRLTESFNALETSLKNLRDQQLKLTKELNGSRSKRVQDKRENNKSIALLVELMQNEEGREKFFNLAQKYNKGLSKEVDRYGELDAGMANIWGMTQEELSGG